MLASSNLGPACARLRSQASKRRPGSYLTLSSRLLLRHARDLVDLGQLVLAQLPAPGLNIGLDLLRLRRPGDHARNGLLAQQPGKRELEQAMPTRLGKVAQLLRDSPVRLGQ